MLALALQKTTFETLLDRFELMHDEHSLVCTDVATSAAKMWNYEHNAPSVSTESSKEDVVGILSAQGQGEQVLFRFLRLQTNRPQSENSPGHMVIYNFKICKQTKVKDIRWFWRSIQKRADRIDIFEKQKAERHCIHNLILVSPNGKQLGKW